MSRIEVYEAENSNLVSTAVAPFTADKPISGLKQRMDHGPRSHSVVLTLAHRSVGTIMKSEGKATNIGYIHLFKTAVDPL